MNKNFQLIGALALLACSFSTTADEVSEAANEGLVQYKKGDLTAAAAQFDYAATMIRQQKAAKIIAVFPEPLAGWEADPAESDSAGGMMLGGAITANRRYFKGDEQSVEIELLMDSPIMQSVLSMFSNPALITLSGGKLINIQGIKGMLKDEQGDLEIQLVVNNAALFTLRGNAISADELKAFAEALKLDKLG